MAGMQVRYETDTSDMLIPHGMFRSVLKDPGDIIAARTAAADFDGITATFTYFDNVLRFLDAHHGGEDELLWPVLTERCAEARALIGTMESQHAGIHAQREACAGALEAWLQTPDVATAAALTGCLEGLRAQLEEHFNQEESDILPLASANVSPEEWGALPGHAMAHFTGDKIWLILGLILEQMTTEQQAFTLTLLPPPVVEMWRGSGRAAFDELVATVHDSAAGAGGSRQAR